MCYLRNDKTFSGNYVLATVSKIFGRIMQKQISDFSLHFYADIEKDLVHKIPC